MHWIYFVVVFTETLKHVVTFRVKVAILERIEEYFDLSIN